jgi:DNA modification methylase
MFPESLAEDHILSWSKEGDLVFDPMCGSGTTLKMAKLNNRKYIGIDINQEYVNISNRRVKEAIPYDNLNKNPKLQFILTREDALAKRKRKTP